MPTFLAVKNKPSSTLSTQSTFWANFFKMLRQGSVFPVETVLSTNYLPMNRVTILFAACFIILSSIHGQVAAGKSDGLVLGQDFISLNAFAFSFGDFMDLYDSLDLNSDGQFDVLFNANAGRVPDYLGGSTSASAIHSKFEIMGDSLGSVQALVLGDSINAHQNWITNDNGSLFWSGFVARFWGFFGQLQQYGDWVSVPEAYAGFRVITAPSDTLYGWMFVKASANSNAANATLKINSWAIQEASVSTHVVEPSTHFVQVQPNPAAEFVEFKTQGQGLDKVLVRLFDLQGKLQREADFSADQGRLNLIGLPVGIYVWELRGKDWIDRGKIVKRQ